MRTSTWPGPGTGFSTSTTSRPSMPASGRAIRICLIVWLSMEVGVAASAVDGLHLGRRIAGAGRGAGRQGAVEPGEVVDG